MVQGCWVEGPLPVSFFSSSPMRASIALVEVKVFLIVPRSLSFSSLFSLVSFLGVDARLPRSGGISYLPNDK